MTDVLAQRVQFYERFIDQWSLKMSLAGRGCWTSSSHLCSQTMDNDEYELIVDKSCNCGSSQFTHTRAESLLLDMKRSQVGWLAHQLFHKEKHVHVELIARLCQQRFDLTWADAIASVRDRTQSKRLDPKREEQMKTKTFAFHFPIQCHCWLVSRFYIMKKCKPTFSSSLNRIFCIFKQFISIFILNLFSNSVCQFNLKEEIQLVFFSYRQIKDVSFPYITKMKLLLCFLKFLFPHIQSCPNRKIHRTNKREQEKIFIEISLLLRKLFD